MAAWTVDSLIDQGPEFVRDFIRQTHTADEFAPEFSWLLLADAIAFDLGQVRTSSPALDTRWAEIAALLYEELAQHSRPQDDLARDIWTRKAARYRAMAANSHPTVHAAPDAREPHPI
jgi:hypothetical protein